MWALLAATSVHMLAQSRDCGSRAGPWPMVAMAHHRICKNFWWSAAQSSFSRSSCLACILCRYWASLWLARASSCHSCLSSTSWTPRPMKRTECGSMHLGQIPVCLRSSSLTHTLTHTHTLRHSWELRVTASWAYYRGFKALSIPSAPRCAQNYYGNAVKATYSVFEATFSGSWPLGTEILIETSQSERATGTYHIISMVHITIFIMYII